MNGRRFASFLRLAPLLVLAAAVAWPVTYTEGKASAPKKAGKAAGAKQGQAKKGHAKKGSKKGAGKSAAGAKDNGPAVIRPDVLAWLVTNNPGLKPNFLKTDLPDRTIRLPDGQTVPIFKLKQFLDVNFRLTFFARKQEKGSEIVPVMEHRLRKLMARPEFHHWIRSHRGEYRISPKGKVSSQQAYDHFRHVNRRLGVTAGKQYHAPVGGGGGIAAPSWAVWRAMNIFEHEACHCIGIGHNSGGLSGPLAGALRTWDRKKMWDYPTIDLNALTVPK